MKIVKSKEELLKYFKEIGAKLDYEGDWDHPTWDEVFVEDMFEYCGLSPDPAWDWEESWLEEEKPPKIIIKEYYPANDVEFDYDICYVELYINTELYDTFDNGGADRRVYQAESVSEGYKLAKPEAIIEIVKVNKEEE